MSLIETTRDRIRTQLRAFILGPGVVERGEMAWGHDQSTFTPPEYGSYLASSNGVYACATLRARLLTQLPVQMTRGRGDEKAEVTSGPAYELLHWVNPHWTLSRLLTMTELSLCLWGSAYWFVERGASGRGKPTEIWWGKPDRVRVVPDPKKYIKGFLYDTGGQPLTFLPSETIWFRYPNPVDEYSGLAPLAAARIGADLASAGMTSNRNLFTNGLQLGGMIYPKSPDTWTVEQVDEISDWFDRRFRGVDKAHRWAVMRSEIGMSEGGVTPRDAEFLGAMRWSLNEICRAYGVPPELVGDHENATYSNIEQANLAIWSHTMVPEARFIAEELSEQFVPMFGRGTDAVEFDTSDVSALQPDETAAWERADAQIQRGVMTVNEWRAEQGLEPVPWGDVWWAPAGVTPIDSPEKPEPKPLPGPLPVGDGAVDDVDVVDAADDSQDGNTAEGDSQDGNDEQSLERAWQTRGLEYGGEEHVRVWTRFVARGTDWEAQVTEIITPLFERQQDAVLQRLKQRSGGRTFEDALADPFDMPRWVREFREKIRPVLRKVVDEAGVLAIADLGGVAAGITFNISQAAVQQFIEGRAQRFAQRVNETTWNMLRTSLSEAIAAGESIPQMEGRVKAIMGDRIRSTPEVIARTEVVGASNGASLESWKQSGVVENKVWLAALDDRTRDSHTEAHGQTVPLNADFVVGGQMGPAPGQIGVPEEDINCRCTMTAEV